MAIARRMGYGMKIIVADKTLHQAIDAAKIMNDAGFGAEPIAVGGVGDFYKSMFANCPAIFFSLSCGSVLWHIL